MERPKVRGGFTLVELLVVLAVIVVLIAILLPAIGKARKRARTAKCLANARSLATTLQNYVTDWGGMFPYYDDVSVASSMPKLWTDIFRERAFDRTYVTTVAMDKVRICPEATTVRYPYGSNTSSNHGAATLAWGPVGYSSTNGEPIPENLIGSYGLNLYVCGLVKFRDIHGNYADVQALFPKSYKLPVSGSESAIPSFIDCNWHTIMPMTTDTPGPNLQDPGPGASNIYFAGQVQPAHPMSRSVLDRHHMAVNVAFLDGHVATTPLKELWGLKWSKDWTPRSASSVFLPAR